MTYKDKWQEAFTAILDKLLRLNHFQCDVTDLHLSPAKSGNVLDTEITWLNSLKETPAQLLWNKNLKTAQKRVKSRIRREAKDQAMSAMTSHNPADAWNYIKRATFTANGGDDLLPMISS